MILRNGNTPCVNYHSIGPGNEFLAAPSSPGAGAPSPASLASSFGSLRPTEEGRAELRVETCRAFLPWGTILDGTVNVDGEVELSTELGFFKRAG